MIELKPCPFCGSDTLKIICSWGWMVDCENGCTDLHEASDEAIEKWNTRAPAPPDWQPIETAPRDGTILLLWNDYVGVFTGLYGDKGWQSWFMCRGTNHYPAPTHWMPLPLPPQTMIKDETSHDTK